MNKIKSKILLTDATGFIGSNLVKKLYNGNKIAIILYMLLKGLYWAKNQQILSISFYVNNILS